MKYDLKMLLDIICSEKESIELIEKIRLLNFLEILINIYLVFLR